MKGILWDMDGTMINNMMIHHQAWQQTLRKLGLDWSIEKVMQDVHGVNDEILVKLFGDRFTAEERHQISEGKEELYRQIYKPNIQLLPGCQAFFDQAMKLNIPMAVATAAPQSNADFVMDTLQLRPYFQGLVHSGMVAQGKPHPEVLEKAAATMGLQPGDCLLFEDSPTGVATAKNANCPVIVLATTHQQAEFSHFTNVLAFVSDFTDLSVSKNENGFGVKLGDDIIYDSSTNSVV